MVNLKTTLIFEQLALIFVPVFRHFSQPMFKQTLFTWYFGEKPANRGIEVECMELYDTRKEFLLT